MALAQLADRILHILHAKLPRVYQGYAPLQALVRKILGGHVEPHAGNVAPVGPAQQSAAELKADSALGHADAAPAPAEQSAAELEADAALGHADAAPAPAEHSAAELEADAKEMDSAGAGAGAIQEADAAVPADNAAGTQGMLRAMEVVCALTREGRGSVKASMFHGYICGCLYLAVCVTGTGATPDVDRW